MVICKQLTKELTENRIRRFFIYIGKNIVSIIRSYDNWIVVRFMLANYIYNIPITITSCLFNLIIEILSGSSCKLYRSIELEGVFL